jgi:hypothetical protein
MMFARWLVALCLLVPVIGRAENVALTFDDLPLNGQLAPGQTYTGVTRDVLAIFKKQGIPPVSSIPAGWKPTAMGPRPCERGSKAASTLAVTRTRIPTSLA